MTTTAFEQKIEQMENERVALGARAEIVCATDAEIAAVCGRQPAKRGPLYELHWAYMHDDVDGRHYVLAWHYVGAAAGG